jgi:hypothetical protein
VAQSADVLYRDVAQLSAEDREIAEKFIRMLQSGPSGPETVSSQSKRIATRACPLLSVVTFGIRR